MKSNILMQVVGATKNLFDQGIVAFSPERIAREVGDIRLQNAILRDRREIFKELENKHKMIVHTVDWRFAADQQYNRLDVDKADLYIPAPRRPVWGFRQTISKDDPYYEAWLKRQNKHDLKRYRNRANRFVKSFNLRLLTEKKFRRMLRHLLNSAAYIIGNGAVTKALEDTLTLRKQLMGEQK